jgi:hypothetical protein
MAPALIPCPHCGCHAKSVEVSCPSCGETLHRGDGSVQRTAVAVLLGLTAAGALAGACSSTGAVISQTGTSSGTGGAGSTTIGAGGFNSHYGTSMTSSSSSSGMVVLYGPAMTSSSSSGGEDGGSTDGGTD